MACFRLFNPLLWRTKGVFLSTQPFTPTIFGSFLVWFLPISPYHWMDWITKVLTWCCVVFSDCQWSKLQSDGRLLLDPLFIPRPVRVPGQRRVYPRHRSGRQRLHRVCSRWHTRHGLLSVGPIHTRVSGKCSWPFLNINGNCLARCLARSMLKLTIIICLSCRPSCFTSRGSAGSLLKED